MITLEIIFYGLLAFVPGGAGNNNMAVVFLDYPQHNARAWVVEGTCNQINPKSAKCSTATIEDSRGNKKREIPYFDLDSGQGQVKLKFEETGSGGPTPITGTRWLSNGGSRFAPETSSHHKDFTWIPVLEEVREQAGTFYAPCLKPESDCPITAIFSLGPGALSSCHFVHDLAQEFKEMEQSLFATSDCTTSCIDPEAQGDGGSPAGSTTCPGPNDTAKECLNAQCMAAKCLGKGVADCVGPKRILKGFRFHPENYPPSSVDHSQVIADAIRFEVRLTKSDVSLKFTEGLDKTLQLGPQENSDGEDRIKLIIANYQIPENRTEQDRALPVIDRHFKGFYGLTEFGFPEDQMNIPHASEEYRLSCSEDPISCEGDMLLLGRLISQQLVGKIGGSGPVDHLVVPHARQVCSPSQFSGLGETRPPGTSQEQFSGAAATAQSNVEPLVKPRRRINGGG